METDKLSILLIGSGFIGTALLNQLIQSGYPVRTISRHLPDSNSELAESYQMEISEALQYPEIWQGVNVAIYTVHHDRPNDRSYDPKNDVDFMLMEKVLDKLNQSDCKKLIYLSSGGAVYGMPQTALVDESHERTPISAYGESKKRIEDLLVENAKNAHLKTLILRPSNVYGDQHPDRITGIINHLISAAKQQKDFTVWGDGYGSKGYLHVDDLTAFILLALQNQESESGIFNVCSEEYYTPRELLKMITDFGYDVRYHFAEQKKFDVSQIQLSSSQARKTFNWKPNLLLKDYFITHLKNS